MKETRTISLNGIAFVIEYDAYQALRDYLSDIELRISIDHQREIMSDLEGRMADLLQHMLFSAKAQVINIDMVKEVQSRLGKPEDFGGAKRPKVKGNQSSKTGVGRVLSIVLKVLLIMLAIQVLFPLLMIVFAICIGLFGIQSGLIALIPALAALPMDGFNYILSSPWITVAFMTCAIVAVVMPLYVLVQCIVTFVRSSRLPKALFWCISLVIWGVSLFGMGAIVSKSAQPVGGLMPFLQQLSTLNDGEEVLTNVEVDDVRSLANFDAIKVSGAITAYISQTSGEYTVKVRSCDPGEIKTYVENGILVVETPKKRSSSDKVLICLPTISSIEGANAADIRTREAIKADSMDIRILNAGHGQINVTAKGLYVLVDNASRLALEGNASNVDLHVKDASDVEADWMLAKDMHVYCVGSSKAEVTAQKQIWIQATGASKVAYSGYAKVKQKVATGGSFIRRD